MHTPPTSFPPTNAGKSGAKPLLLKIKPEGERSDNKTREEISKMEPGSRRRYERNQREKLRSFRISKQIKDLQTVLTALQIPYKNNKFSVLVSAVAFIRAGQEEVWRGERWCGVLRGICERAEALAKEEEGLGEGEEGLGQEEDKEDVEEKHEEEYGDSEDGSGAKGTDFLKSVETNLGVDWASVFLSMPQPCALTLSKTSTFLECNPSFLALTNLTLGQLKRKTIDDVVEEDGEGRKRLKFGEKEEVEIKRAGKLMCLGVKTSTRVVG